MTNEDGKSKGFGFISFEAAEQVSIWGTSVLSEFRI
jgi:hypothetical protein